MSDFAGSTIGSDQSLQVASGRAELPARVRKAMPLESPTHVKRPQRATVPESWGGDSNQPLDPGPVASRRILPALPVAAKTLPGTPPRCDAIRRVASPSLDCATSVA